MSDREQPAAQVRRRDFLKILGAAGAAGAAASTGACVDPSGYKLIPYLVSPDETVPMVSNYDTSVCRECSAGCGILMETRDGHTFKLEGNPSHPLSRGAICARGMSAVQGLYNPDRWRSAMARVNGKLTPLAWERALEILGQKLADAQTKSANGIVFINQHESGSFPSFLDGWLANYGAASHLSVDATADGGTIAANKQSYGVAWPSLDFGAARLIVSFGADFLEGWGTPVSQQLDFADARAKLADAPRVWYVGPRRSLTGLNADEWIACKPGTAGSIVAALEGTMSAANAAQAAGVPVAQI